MRDHFRVSVSPPRNNYNMDRHVLVALFLVGTVLLMIFKGYRLTQAKGAVLFALSLVFAASFFFVYQSP